MFVVLGIETYTNCNDFVVFKPIMTLSVCVCLFTVYAGLVMFSIVIRRLPPASADPWRCGNVDTFLQIRACGPNGHPLSILAFRRAERVQEDHAL